MTSLLNKLLLPGIHVMQSGRFFKKMAILVTIMLVPIILLTYLLHSEIRKTIDFAAGERAGVRYLLPLSEILIELSRDISPEINTDKLTQQAAIVDQNEERLAETLKTSEAWHELKPLLQQQNAEQRQAAIEKTIELIAIVGDNSGLVLDPDIDSYYLMDVVVVKYPTILHKTNQMAYLAATTHSTARSIDEHIRMAMANGAVRSTLESVQSGVQKVEAANSSITGAVTAFNGSNAATEKLLVLANPVGVTAEQPFKAESLRAQLAQTTEQNAMAYRLYLKDLDELLAQRIERGKMQERNIFIIVLVVLLLAGYLLLALYFSMKKSIVNIFAATQLFSTGDWRHRVAITSADELGDIASSLNEVRSQIHPMVSGIMQSAEKVMGASEELTANAGQVAKVANQMANAVSEMSGGAEQQLYAVHKSNNAIRQVMEGIERVAANTNLVTIAANKTADAAEQGTSTVDTAVQQMHSIETAVGHSAEVVDKLGARSQEIGQIVNTISGIAAQTNLLALNAAIEAARAGEQGRGFAVVADEVRQLAEESQLAAKQIAALIAEIQRDTVNAVETMQSGTDVVQVGSKVVRSAGDSFKEIVQLIREEAGEIKEISATLAQITPQTQTALAAADEIVSVSNAAVEQTQSVSAAGEEHSASMQEIASSSHELAALAERLQQSVKSFQI